MSPTVYPGAFDSFNNPDDSSGDDLDTPGVLHDQQHSDANDAIEAIEHVLGVEPNGAYATVRAYIDAVGTALLGAMADTPEALYVLTDDIPTTGTAGAEETLQSVIIPPGQLSRDGDKLHCRWTGSAIAHATATRRMRMYFGGTQLMDTTAYASTYGGVYSVDLEIVRVSNSVVRVSATGGFPPYSALSPLPFAAGGYAEVTGLDLSDWQELKATGAVGGVGAASGDMVGRSMTVTYHPGP